MQVLQGLVLLEVVLQDFARFAPSNFMGNLGRIGGFLKGKTGGGKGEIFYRRFRKMDKPYVGCFWRKE